MGLAQGGRQLAGSGHSNAHTAAGHPPGLGLQLGGTVPVTEAREVTGISTPSSAPQVTRREAGREMGWGNESFLEMSQHRCEPRLTHPRAFSKVLTALRLLKSLRRLAAMWARRKGSGEEINSIDPELYLIFAGAPRQLWSQRGVGGPSSGDRICGQELRGPGLRLRHKCPLPAGRAPRGSGACRPGIGRLAGG